MTVLFSSNIEEQYRALWLLEASKNFFAMFLMFTTVMLNTCLAIDLILMIKHPFKAKEKRVTNYVVASITLSFVLVLAWTWTLEYQPNTKWGIWPMPCKTVEFSAYAILLIFLVTSFASIVYAIRKLR